eukprot:2748553-Rhodomonas_salina.1
MSEDRSAMSSAAFKCSGITPRLSINFVISADFPLPWMPTRYVTGALILKKSAAYPSFTSTPA